MRIAGLQGVHRRRWRHSQPAAAVSEDRVQRRFHPDRPDKLWCTDITQHRTSEGWVYCAVVLDVVSPAGSSAARPRTTWCTEIPLAT